LIVSLACSISCQAIKHAWHGAWMSSFRYTPGPLGDELHAWMPSPILRTRNVLVIFSNSMTVHIVIRDRARPVSQGRNQKSRTGLCFGERGTCSGSRRITSSTLASQPVFLFDLWPESNTWRRRANHDVASADDGHARTRTARARKGKKKKSNKTSQWPPAASSLI
jgi:hypothetical protein